MSRSTAFTTLALAVFTLTACVTASNPSPEGTTIAPTAITPRATTVLSKPQYQVGDRWLYSDGYGMEVTEVSGDRTRFLRLDDPSQYFINRGLFREEAKSHSALRRTIFQSEDPEQLYGGPVGRSVVFVREYIKDRAMVRHSTSWTIDGYETITVPAGTFDTIRLTKRSRSQTGNWTGFERWWYAPAVRNYVRMEFKYGDAPESARVLVEHRAAAQK